MIASLPMYDWPEVRPATDAWWRCISRHAGAGFPLTREADYAACWSHPDLVFTQTCGYPFTHAFAGQLNYLATPHFAAEGCNGPTYCSFILAREKLPLAALKGATAVINGADSMSGMLALKLVFAPLAASARFFGKTLVSGSHLQSMRLVQQGQGDVCAIDSVCIGLAQRYRPDLLAGLVEIARSPQVPGLPYVTRAQDVGNWRRALAAAFADPASAEARDKLLLTGHTVLPAGAYEDIPRLEREMEGKGDLNL